VTVLVAVLSIDAADVGADQRLAEGEKPTWVINPALERMLDEKDKKTFRQMVEAVGVENLNSASVNFTTTADGLYAKFLIPLGVQQKLAAGSGLKTQLDSTVSLLRDIGTSSYDIRKRSARVISIDGELQLAGIALSGSEPRAIGTMTAGELGAHGINHNAAKKYDIVLEIAGNAKNAGRSTTGAFAFSLGVAADGGIEFSVHIKLEFLALFGPEEGMVRLAASSLMDSLKKTGIADPAKIAVSLDVSGGSVRLTPVDAR